MLLLTIAGREFYTRMHIVRGGGVSGRCSCSVAAVVTKTLSCGSTFLNHKNENLSPPEVLNQSLAAEGQPTGGERGCAWAHWAGRGQLRTGKAAERDRAGAQLCPPATRNGGGGRCQASPLPGGVDVLSPCWGRVLRDPEGHPP